MSALIIYLIKANLLISIFSFFISSCLKRKVLPAHGSLSLGDSAVDDPSPDAGSDNFVHPIQQEHAPSIICWIFIVISIYRIAFLTVDQRTLPQQVLLSILSRGCLY